ncbi:uncharacterized protein BDZ83DRAFT_754668 [Colletotrichum acutatum]|uniref:Uncharacterized protein n=1 Tax=Glomerella acutata TaxID=27357 RepID=A0AAD8UIF5_GLOAC|nr:uncharacterized protein BDZ83DRAFT_754668 [Colletotrichum acutatum]KAK1721325.1 hypothetical protein BDZ83DRAFT_754668 [Colletotrichum acutatum]
MYQQAKSNKSTSKGGSASMNQQTQLAREVLDPAHHQVKRHGLSRSEASIVDDPPQSNHLSSKKSKSRRNMVDVDRPWPRGKEAQEARLGTFSMPVDASVHDPSQRWYYDDMADQPYNAIGEVEMPARNSDEIPTSGEDDGVWPYEAVTSSGMVWYGSVQ